MATFTFSEKDILNSLLVPTGPSISYVINTKEGLLGPKVTTLAPTTQNGYYPALSGAILWREDSFEIGGERKKWAEVKYRPHGMFSGTREWQWSRQRYRLKRRHWRRRVWPVAYRSARERRR